MEEQPNSYESYSAPKQHGEFLIAPELEWAVDRLQSGSLSGPSSVSNAEQQLFLQKWRVQAKSEILSQALAYTSTYRDVGWLKTTDSHKSVQIALSGHQPELFHCGVWFKNFLISRLGECNNTVAINFIVDNDLCRVPGIQVPTFSNNQVTTQLVTYDQIQDETPWENRRLINKDLWNSFASRVSQVIPQTSGQPLLHQLWQHAAGLDRDQPLGLILSQARHLLECDAGLKTLEVPLSQLCNTATFAAFSLHLLARASELREAYNTELDAYRAAHRIRNHAQPLPNLETHDGWQEVPWWCYSVTSSRKSMYIKEQNGLLMLSDLENWQEALHGPLDSDAAIEQWMAFANKRMRIRPRALITTMFTRLLMSDLFVHGIGGGKYDQITNRIISRLFRIEPPPMVVATATMRLSLQGIPAELVEPVEPRLQAVERLFNSAASNPERLLEQKDLFEVPEDALKRLQSLADEKKKLLTSIPSKGEKWEWHVAMKKIKQQLSDVAHLRLVKSPKKLSRSSGLTNSSFC